MNDKIFVESSMNLDAIWNRHRTQLNFGSHPNVELQKDWKELGEAKFACEILGEVEQMEDKDYSKEVKLLGEMYIEELKPFDMKGYNKRMESR